MSFEAPTFTHALAHASPLYDTGHSLLFKEVLRRYVSKEFHDTDAELAAALGKYKLQVCIDTGQFDRVLSVKFNAHWLPISAPDQSRTVRW